MNIIDKIVNVLTRPYEFFKGLKKEKGIKEAFTYYAILFLFFSVLATVFGLFMESFSFNLISRLFSASLLKPEYHIGWVIFWAVIGYGLGLGLSFVWAGLLHVWILIFGGKGDYKKTYQLFVYSQTPKLVFGWFPFIGYIVWVYDLILLIIGTERVHKLSKLRSILMYVIPVAVIFILTILLFILGAVFLFKMYSSGL
jgi:hypothetical protein